MQTNNDDSSSELGLFGANIGHNFFPCRPNVDFFDLEGAHQPVNNMSHSQMLGKFEYGLPAKF